MMEGEVQPKAAIGLTTSIFTSRYRGVVAAIMPGALPTTKGGGVPVYRG